MEAYVTKKGDVLDYVLWSHFGFDQGAEKSSKVGLFPQYAEELPQGLIEATYALNPHLSLLQAILPEGVEILLPEQPDQPKANAPQSAWGV